MPIRIEVDLSGPIAEGEAPGIMGRYVEHVTNVLSDRAVTMIRAYLPTQYMYLGHSGGDPKDNPVPPGAGALAASVHYERQSEDETIVIGDDVIYGPWIEGVAPGNSFFWPGRVARGLSPRFPGYQAFRKISQVLDNMAGPIAEIEIVRYIDELNG